MTDRVRMLCVAIVVCVAQGCVDSDDVRRQKVPKIPTALSGDVIHPDSDVLPPAGHGASGSPSEPIDGRMLAAIVPAGGKAWFFKIMGASGLVADQQAGFRGLLDSLKPDGDKLAWDVPEGWSEQLGAGMRAATFRMGSGDTKLECSVIPLPSEDPTSIEYVLANVNRWRGQLGLDAQTEDDFATAIDESDDAQQFKSKAGVAVTYVNIEGKIAGSGGAPMMGATPGKAAGPTLPPGHPPTTGQKPAGPSGPSAPKTKAVTSIPEMAFDAPASWTPKPNSSSFRKVSWSLSGGGPKAEMYISTLAAGGSDVAANVGRWRGQVNLEPLSGAALMDSVEEISVGGVDGHLAEMIGEEQAILAAIVVKGETGWFFTLKAPAEIAKGETENFRAFLKSVKFN